MHLPANLLVKNDVCVNVTGRTPVGRLHLVLAKCYTADSSGEPV